MDINKNQLDTCAFLHRPGCFCLIWDCSDQCGMHWCSGRVCPPPHPHSMNLPRMKKSTLQKWHASGRRKSRKAHILLTYLVMNYVWGIFTQCVLHEATLLKCRQFFRRLPKRTGGLLFSLIIQFREIIFNKARLEPFSQTSLIINTPATIFHLFLFFKEACVSLYLQIAPLGLEYQNCVRSVKWAGGSSAFV